MKIQQLLEFAIDIVKDAADIGITNGANPQIIRDKPGGDLVTDADLGVETFIKDAVYTRFPEHDFISEESEGKSTGSIYEWILDPVDGTKYYARRVPLYAISLALRIDGKLSLGVVYSPLMGQLFTAASGIGAFLNGEQIFCSHQDKLAEAMVCAEIPSRHSTKEDRDRALGQLRTVIDSVQRVRVIGVSSLGLCWTAMGGFDAYVNLGSASHIWDVAGGRVSYS